MKTGIGHVLQRARICWNRRFGRNGMKWWYRQELCTDFVLNAALLRKWNNMLKNIPPANLVAKSAGLRTLINWR